MATLKNLLETTMLKLGSAGAQSSNANPVNIELDLEATPSTWQEYVPPADGFVAVDTTISSLVAITCAGLAIRGQTVNDWTSVMLPVRKSRTTRFQLVGITSPSTFTARFIKSVGGGIIEFLRSLFAKEVAYVC